MMMLECLPTFISLTFYCSLKFPLSSTAPYLHDHILFILEDSNYHCHVNLEKIFWSSKLEGSAYFLENTDNYEMYAYNR